MWLWKALGVSNTMQNIYICKYAEACGPLSVEYVVVVQLTVRLNCIFFFRFDVDTANVFSADLHVVPITDVRWGVSWGTGLQNEAASCVLSLSVEVWSVEHLLVH